MNRFEHPFITTLNVCIQTVYLNCHAFLNTNHPSSALYKSAILDFLQKLPFAFAQNVLGRANFAILWRQFFYWHEIGARILCLLVL